MWAKTDAFTYDAHHDWSASRTTTFASSIKAAFAYTRDDLGRITRVAKTSDANQIYGDYGNGAQGLTTYYAYDDRSQLTSEVTKVGATSTVLAGRDDAYAFDNLGNRASSAGTTHNGTTANYTTNALNQYSARTVPGVFDVAGAAGTGTTVTVTRSGGATDTAARSGRYFFDGYGLTNTSAVYTTLDISDGTTTSHLPAYVAATPEGFTYDVDGNMLTDGRWTYTYDAENRLLTMESLSAGSSRQKLTFAYDYLNRRVSKKVESAWGGSSYATIDSSIRYLYDGWNMLIEFDAQSSLALLKAYVWGLDLSGTLQGAGGTGGLLGLYDYVGTHWYVPVYDALGNIHGYTTNTSVTLGSVSYAAGDLVATFEYDGFGRTLRESGNFADSGFFRYSTQYADIETGLIYYGQRYYSPSMGRFINKDPIEERGGLNLYGFCGNNGVNSYDMLGRDAFMIIDDYGQWWEGDGPTGEQLQRGKMAAQSAGAATVSDNSGSTDSFGGDTERWGDWNTVFAFNSAGGEAHLNERGITASITLNQTQARALTLGFLLQGATPTFLNFTSLLGQNRAPNSTPTGIKERANPKDVAMINTLAANPYTRQLAINKALTTYGINTHGTISITYDPSQAADGDTSKNGIITIGPGAFSGSAGWLGSALGHEIEIHFQEQAQRGFWFTDGQGTNVQEVQAYDYELRNAGRFGLTATEIRTIREDYRLPYFNGLTMENKISVSSGNYTTYIPRPEVPVGP